MCRFQHFVLPPEERNEILESAWSSYDQIEKRRALTKPLFERANDLREACALLPNLRNVEVCFNRFPSENEVLRHVFADASCRSMDRQRTYSNLDAIIAATDGLSLSAFRIDRLPLELFRLPDHRRHWFAHTESFANLETLHLTLDPSGLKGPGSALRAVNGLGRLLHLARDRLHHLKLAFHPYARSHSKFVVTFRELLSGGFAYPHLTDLTLEGLSCEERDLVDFLTRHAPTLTRLRLGGRGLARPHEASLGGIHLYQGTFKSLFTALRQPRLPHLERLHLEGVFECQNHEPSSQHESYNFYPLTDEDWQPVPPPRWVRASRSAIHGEPFERYVLDGGPYPGRPFGHAHGQQQPQDHQHHHPPQQIQAPLQLQLPLPPQPQPQPQEQFAA